MPASTRPQLRCLPGILGQHELSTHRAAEDPFQGKASDCGASAVTRQPRSTAHLAMHWHPAAIHSQTANSGLPFGQQAGTSFTPKHTSSALGQHLVPPVLLHTSAAAMQTIWLGISHRSGGLGTQAPHRAVIHEWQPAGATHLWLSNGQLRECVVGCCQQHKAARGGEQADTPVSQGRELITARLWRPCKSKTQGVMLTAPRHSLCDTHLQPQVPFSSQAVIGFWHAGT